MFRGCFGVVSFCFGWCFGFKWLVCNGCFGFLAGFGEVFLAWTREKPNRGKQGKRASNRRFRSLPISTIDRSRTAKAGDWRLFQRAINSINLNIESAFVNKELRCTP
jgi:hypothetical protein